MIVYQYFFMNNPKKLISSETFAIFQKHSEKLKSFDSSISELPTKNANDFSYSDRYFLKKKDKSKQRFCENVQLSK